MLGYSFWARLNEDPEAYELYHAQGHYNCDKDYDYQHEDDWKR